MLACGSTPSSSSTAKLVDFGLHTLVDAHTPKLVKRMFSEANVGETRVGGLRPGLTGMRPPVHKAEDGDELEHALEQQRVGAAKTATAAATPRSNLSTTTPMLELLSTDSKEVGSDRCNA